MSAIRETVADRPVTYPRSAAMYVINEASHLIYEALSRARMRSPQTTTSEARRSARDIAMHARHQQARQLGHQSHL